MNLLIIIKNIKAKYTSNLFFKFVQYQGLNNAGRKTNYHKLANQIFKFF